MFGPLFNRVENMDSKQLIRNQATVEKVDFSEQIDTEEGQGGPGSQ